MLEPSKLFFAVEDTKFLNFLLSKNNFKLKFLMFFYIFLQELSQTLYLILNINKVKIETLTFSIYLVIMFLNLFVSIWNITNPSSDPVPAGSFNPD